MVVTLARDSVGPVIGNCFNAVTQVAQLLCSEAIPAERFDTVRLTLSATYQPSGEPASGALVRLSARPVHASGERFSSRCQTAVSLDQSYTGRVA